MYIFLVSLAFAGIFISAWRKKFHIMFYCAIASLFFDVITCNVSGIQIAQIFLLCSFFRDSGVGNIVVYNGRVVLKYFLYLCVFDFAFNAVFLLYEGVWSFIPGFLYILQKWCIALFFIVIALLHQKISDIIIAKRLR